VREKPSLCIVGGNATTIKSSTEVLQKNKNNNSFSVDSLNSLNKRPRMAYQILKK
jgi:hypothetical protein